tara:strand:- start:23 stop:247 length:225 start_codon:yes stop_codon:yes gene_type:complete
MFAYPLAGYFEVYFIWSRSQKPKSVYVLSQLSTIKVYAAQVSWIGVNKIELPILVQHIIKREVAVDHTLWHVIF